MSLNRAAMIVTLVALGIGARVAHVHAQAYAGPPPPQTGFYNTGCTNWGQYCSFGAVVPPGSWYIDVFGWEYDSGQYYQVEDVGTLNCGYGQCFTYTNPTVQAWNIFWSGWKWGYFDYREQVFNVDCYPIPTATPYSGYSSTVMTPAAAAALSAAASQVGVSPGQTGPSAEHIAAEKAAAEQITGNPHLNTGTSSTGPVQRISNGPLKAPPSSTPTKP